MTNNRPLPRYVGMLVLVALAGFAAVGFLTIRRDVDNLRVISQDNTQWSASQMEVELVRFRMSLAALRLARSAEALEAMHERFDILWSRVFMLGHGEVGESLARHDAETGSVSALAEYLQKIDPTKTPLDLDAAATLDAIEATLADHQQALRQNTLLVLRADADAAERVRVRIKANARTTGLVSLAAILITILSLVLIQREIRRQDQAVELSRRSAEASEQASRAKSRFLTMMSHELRNPLNGVLGPLALLGQGELSAAQRRLVTQARSSGEAMLRMLSGLLDYGEVEDGKLRLKSEPFRVASLAAALREALRSEGVAVEVRLRPDMPERVRGDVDRLQQVFVHLTTYLLEERDAAGMTLAFGHAGGELIGDVALPAGDPDLDGKLALLTGRSEFPSDQVTAEALRPLVARGVIAALGGGLTLVGPVGGVRNVRVRIPAEPVRFEQIRIYFETRSAALATIYQAALRSDRVAFVSGGESGPVDVVLVDSTGPGEVPLMSRLRARFPGALFVSLGLPQSPDFFDDVVETPHDMTRLRTSILGRLAS